MQLFDLSLAVNKPEKSWHGFFSHFLLLASVCGGKEYIRFAFPFQSCSTAQGLNVVMKFVMPLPFFSLHHSIRKNYQTAAFIMLYFSLAWVLASYSSEVTNKQRIVDLVLHPTAIRFVLSSTIFRILRV